MFRRLEIHNKIIISFTILYSIYLIVTSIVAYNNNVKILTESLQHRITENYYQLANSLNEDIRTDNRYQINTKINNFSERTSDLAYIIVYDSEKNIVSSNLKDIPEKLSGFSEEREKFMDFSSSKGDIIDYVSKIEDLDIAYIRLGFYTDSIDKKLYSEFFSMLLINAVVFVIILIISFYVSRLVGKPIAKLTSVTNEISSKENYNTLLNKDYYSSDFHELIESINRMIISNERNKKNKNRLLNKVFRIQEDERKLLSRELHDEVSQSLASLLFLLSNLINKEDDDKKKGRLILIKDELDSSLSNIRNIAVNLRPALLEEHGLIQSLEKYIEDYINLYSIDVKFKYSSNSIYNENFNLTIYRIIQESLSNIKKHSKADKVSIQFLESDVYTILEIADNGIGFDMERMTAAIEEGRLGIYGIRERVLDFNGKFELTSSHDYKTIIRCKFKNKDIREV